MFLILSFKTELMPDFFGRHSVGSEDLGASDIVISESSASGSFLM